MRVNTLRRVRRHVIRACLFMCLACFASSPVFAEATAVDLSREATVAVTDSAGKTYPHMQLLDGRYTTKLSLPAGSEVSIRSDLPIHGVYLIWDRPPGPWALRTLEQERTSMYLQGREDWIHEYVMLPEPSTEVVIGLLDREAILCEVAVFGDGILPDHVQVWQPPYEDADMLVLPTHADDEHLFFGGTMPAYAGERGYKVQVAYLTNHWAEPYRPHELLNGLWTVGIRAYPVIGEFIDYYSDNLEHAKELYDRDRVIEHQVEMIRRFRPEVIIGHDIDGEYGHGVHMLNTWALQQAIDLAADASYTTSRDDDVFQVSKVYLHLYPERAVIMNWNNPLERFDGKTALDMAKEGFAQHVSQQKWFSVRTAGVHDCRAFGLYYTTVGDDPTEGDPDFFYNVFEFSDDPVQESPDEDIENGDVDDPETEAEETGQPFALGLNGALILSGVLAALFVLLAVWARSRERS